MKRDSRMSTVSVTFLLSALTLNICQILLSNFSSRFTVKNKIKSHFVSNVMAESTNTPNQRINSQKPKRQNRQPNLNHVFRKRQPQKPEVGPNVIYVSTKTSIKVIVTLVFISELLKCFSGTPRKVQ